MPFFSHLYSSVFVSILFTSYYIQKSKEEQKKRKRENKDKKDRIREKIE
jgi:hypothetical protein